MLKKVLSFQSNRLSYGLALGWSLLGMAMACWWLYFGLNKIEEIKQNKSIEVVQLIRQQKMIMQEGIFLVFLFAVGGMALAYFIHREQKRKNLLNQFFASFTHDIKTGLSRLNLHIESLGDDKNGPLKKILIDSSRLQLIMENALGFYSSPFSSSKFTQVELATILRRLKSQFTELEIQLQKKCQVEGDEVAFESIIKNLFHNAVYHGGATEIKINVQSLERDYLKIIIEDNGKGFDGDFSKLGLKPLNNRGIRNTGLGLYLIHAWIKNMGGEINFYSTSQKGFGVELKVKGQII